ncbi:MAG: SDR family oxidoreductase [Elusimicrobia bacterium]|nr:SDR family oxidoreductase [Elusimicrobiota bacterium]
MPSTDPKNALVTGANRGIGFEICRQLARKGLRVVLASRNEPKGREACDKLRQEGLEVDLRVLDVKNFESIQKTRDSLIEKYGRLDVLVNNAGILLDSPGFDSSLFDTRPETVRQTVETNLIGPLILCQMFVPLMREKGYGRVVNISSGSGQFSEMEAGSPAYSLSKTALNALTKLLSLELQGTDVLVNAMCPGWVRTDMGGPSAPRSPEQGADTAVWLATLPKGGPQGSFFRDRKPIPW